MPLAIGSAFPRNRKYSPSFLPPQKTTSYYLLAILSLCSRRPHADNCLGTEKVDSKKHKK